MIRLVVVAIKMPGDVPADPKPFGCLETCKQEAHAKPNKTPGSFDS